VEEALVTERVGTRQRRDPAHGTDGPHGPDACRIILSFDVEEHYRIEAAARLDVEPELKAHYRERLDYSTRWLLDRLEGAHVRATFFIVGEIVRHNPALIRAIARAGHEVASHGWDHRRTHHFNPVTFREDIRRCKEALEDVAGQAVLGHRAPTFSIVRETAWALDVLAELGMAYDSSIYPVRHDRYGVPAAPRSPFLARGEQLSLLELPPATLRLLGWNLPMGGGGYFRLFPLFLMEQAIRQMARDCSPPVVTLYFHPWEFDPGQRRLPLKRLSAFRTYVGIGRTQGRLKALLARHSFVRAIDLAKRLDSSRRDLPCFDLARGALEEPTALAPSGVSVNQG
jgi:polysaccharide deacetylase family protein (PEP-CTERM system associated)